MAQCKSVVSPVPVYNGYHCLALSHQSQIAKTLESTSIWHRSDTEVSDRCLINADPRVFAIWNISSSWLLSEWQLCSLTVSVWDWKCLCVRYLFVSFVNALCTWWTVLFQRSSFSCFILENEISWKENNSFTVIWPWKLHFTSVFGFLSMAK